MALASEPSKMTATAWGSAVGEVESSRYVSPFNRNAPSMRRPNESQPIVVGRFIEPRSGDRQRREDAGADNDRNYNGKGKRGHKHDEKRPPLAHPEGLAHC